MYDDEGSHLHMKQASFPEGNIFLYWALREKCQRKEKSTALTQLHCILNQFFLVQPMIIFLRHILSRANINFVGCRRTTSNRIHKPHPTGHQLTPPTAKQPIITLISLQSHPPHTFFRCRAGGGAEELLHGGDLAGFLISFLLLKLGEGGERGLRVGLWRLCLRGTVTADISRLLFSLQPWKERNTSLHQSVWTSFFALWIYLMTT